MKSRKAIVWLALLLLLAIIVYTHRDRIHFDWAIFFQQLRHISWPHIAAGIALIYSTYWLRATRWSVFLRATKKVSPLTLVGPQFIGFTAVALFGRLADVIRPALVAKRVQLPISTQIAVYTIERMFDLGAAAIIFSSALLFAPRDLPHHDIFIHTGEISLAGTAFLALFAVTIRVAGGAVASAVHAHRSVRSPPRRRFGRRQDSWLPRRPQRHLLRAGLRHHRHHLPCHVGSHRLRLRANLLHAFVATPELATISFSSTMLPHGSQHRRLAPSNSPSSAGSPRSAVTAAAMNQFYGAPIEAATALRRTPPPRHLPLYYSRRPDRQPASTTSASATPPPAGVRLPPNPHSDLR